VGQGSRWLIIICTANAPCTRPALTPFKNIVETPLKPKPNTKTQRYVDDLIRGLVAVMDGDEHIGPFNVGNPGEFTMLELAQVVKEVVNPRCGWGD
jgi:nucleoside-diphosphate-sugar epimerase